jgi:hypothetical protein
VTSNPVETETQRPAGRVLPLPQKPKKRGHQAPGPEDTTVVDVREERPTPTPTSPASDPKPAPQRLPAKPVTSGVGIDKGPVKTIYSDRGIDDFLHQVRVEATVARLDLTHSAVWRLAMHEFHGSPRPADVVVYFAQASSKNGQVGRPKR